MSNTTKSNATFSQDELKQVFSKGHIYNLCAIEQIIGMRRLKLNEFVNGRAKLSDYEVLKISELVMKPKKN